jgi:hypothetical protein
MVIRGVVLRVLDACPGKSMRARLFRSAAAALLLALLGTACSERDVATAPVQPATPAARSSDLLGLSGVLGGVTRLVCPTSQEADTTAVIGPGGGTLAAGGVRVQFPAGAVANNQAFSLRLLPGENVDVELDAVGYDHYTFAVPVAVTIDLHNCGTLPLGLRAFYIDSETKALLEDMGGDLDILGGKLRFTTPHFSGYTVAW